MVKEGEAGRGCFERKVHRREARVQGEEFLIG